MRSAVAFAVAREEVRADVIEISHYPLLARQYGVMAVPKVVINEALTFEGALPPAEFARAVVEAVARTAPGDRASGSGGDPEEAGA